MTTTTQSENRSLKNLKIFSSHFSNHVFALLLYFLIWLVLSFFIPADIPSPFSVFSDIGDAAGENYIQAHFLPTLLRTLGGFLTAFALGSGIGLLSFMLRAGDYINTLLIFFHISPGLVIGIILLGIFGAGSAVPVVLIIFLVTPLISINTSNALLKRDTLLEDYIIVSGGKRTDLLLDSYLPSLAPAIRSNYTIGFGLALKVVVLGEFIGSMTGIGYRLNVAYVYMNLDEVFFHFTVILLIMLFFQILFSLLNHFFLGKLLYNE